MPRGGYRKGAGGKPTWKHGKTKVIRVPEVLADKVIEYAKKLDRGEIEEKVKPVVKVEAFKVVDLGGVKLKAIDGQMGVMVGDLIKRGYTIKPDRLQELIVRSPKFR